MPQTFPTTKTTKQPLPFDFTDQKTLERSIAYVKSLVTFDDVPRAYAMAKNLPVLLKDIPGFDTRYPDLAQAYRVLLAKLRAISLPFLSDEQFELFFQDDIGLILDDDDLPLIDKIDAKVVRTIMLEDRDVLKQKARNRLLQSTVHITEAPLTLAGQPVPATIQNWLRDYNAVVGATASVETLQQTQYLAKKIDNKVIADQVERKIIRRLIDVYEHLKLSSVTPQGLEEQVSIVHNNRKLILNHGRLERVRVDEMVKILSTGEKILGIKPTQVPDTAIGRLGEEENSYQEYQTEIKQTMDRIVREAGDDPAKIKGIFIQAVDAGNIDEVTATMHYLAGKGELVNVLKENATWRTATQEHAAKRYNDPKAGQFIEKNPTSPEVLSEFFQYLLREQLGLSPEESALIGMDVSMLMGRPFEGIAYWDEATGAFGWALHKIAAGRLVTISAPAPVAAMPAVAAEPTTPAQIEAIEDIGAATLPPADPIGLLKQKYQAYRRQRQAVLKREDTILVQTKGDLEAVKRELATASRQNQKDTVIACLLILARQGALVTALKDNPAWFTAVAEYIQQKYGKQYKPDELKYAISNLKLDPTTEAALSEFLQYLLKEKLQMTENDSALVGVEIGQLLGALYQSLAYGNQETGNFEWIKNRITDKKLVSEIN